MLAHAEKAVGLLQSVDRPLSDSAVVLVQHPYGADRFDKLGYVVTVSSWSTNVKTGNLTTVLNTIRTCYVLKPGQLMPYHSRQRGFDLKVLLGCMQVLNLNDDSTTTILSAGAYHYQNPRRIVGFQAGPDEYCVFEGVSNGADGFSLFTPAFGKGTEIETAFDWKLDTLPQL